MSANATEASSRDARKRIDPTRTSALRTRLSGRLAGAYGKINAQIRRDVVERDVFGTRQPDILTEPTDQLAADDYPQAPRAGGNYDPQRVPRLTRSPPSEQTRRFREWLDRQQERGVQGNLSRRHNPWIDRAYGSGVRGAERALRAADRYESVDGTDPEEVPGHDRTTDAARARFDDRLTAATQATTSDVSETLLAALVAGVAASVIASQIVDRINHSLAGVTRVRALAQGEIVRVHNEARLDRYEQAGVSEVGVRPEARADSETVDADDSNDADDTREARWAAILDARICAQCRSLAGSTHSIADIRSGDAPLPVRDTHDRCRCAYVLT
jgi:hypothetical protein